MDRRGVFEDISYLLFLVPFAGSAVYALALWVGQGISFILPENVYLSVTRSPGLFLLGSFSVMLGVILDVSTESVEKRGEAVVSLSRRLQGFSIASLILAILTAWYANAFTLNLGAVASDVFVGRYNIVFPALLLVLSFLIATPLSLEKTARLRVAGIIILLLVPAILYEVGRRSTNIALAASFLLLVIGTAILSRY